MRNSAQKSFLKIFYLKIVQYIYDLKKRKNTQTGNLCLSSKVLQICTLFSFCAELRL